MRSYFKALYSLIIAFCIKSIFSTTFIPHSIDNQLRNSSGVIFGTYLGKNFKRDKNGDVVTEVILSVKNQFAKI